MPAPTMEAPALEPQAETPAEPPVIENDPSFLDLQAVEDEAAKREAARTGIKTELRDFSYDQVTSDKPWQNLSEENQAVFEGLARDKNPKLFDRNPAKAQDKLLREVQREMFAERLVESRLERQAAKAEKTEAKRATLEGLEPKERFSRLRNSYKSLKAVYQERRAKRAESKGSEVQTTVEETPDSRLQELIAKGMDEPTANTVINVADRIAANRANIDRTKKQQHRYALDVTRRAVLGQFDIAKLADSQEAKEALMALRKEVRFLLDGEEATEPAELDVLVAEQQPAIEEEVTEFENRNRAREIGVAAMAATIALTGAGVVAAETLGNSSPAAVIEVADETNQADNSTFTTASGETFRMGSPQALTPDVATLDSLMGLPGTEPRDAVAAAEAGDDTPGTVAVSAKSGGEVDADKKTVLADEYSVVEGDSLWKIIKNRLGPDASDTDIANEVNRVAELNKLKNPSLIDPGQIIKFTASSSQGSGKIPQ